MKIIKIKKKDVFLQMAKIGMDVVLISRTEKKLNDLATELRKQ